MSEEAGKWQELPRSIKSTCPKVFYNFAYQQDGFALRLTDLVEIWQCQMTRTEILDLSEKQQSSIDPSESNTQARVLLEKLQLSLESGDNFLFRYTDDKPHTIYLRTKLILPRPLKPLAWTFKLDPQDASELAERLLRPCLHEASSAKHKLQSLLRTIKDKDHVLSRLLEKIDNSAIDLGLIFPGITGLRSRRGKVTVAEARKHVPGMTEFDPDKWALGFDGDSIYSGFDQMGMRNLVVGCEKCPKHTTKQHADWLLSLPVRDERYGDVKASQRTLLKRKTSQLDEEDGSTETEDEYERQPTPTHLRKAAKHSEGEAHAHSESSTEGDAISMKKTKIGKLVGGSGGAGRMSKSRDLSRHHSTSSKSSHISEQNGNLAHQAPRNLIKASTSDTETEIETDSEIAVSKGPVNVPSTSRQYSTSSSKPREFTSSSLSTSKSTGDQNITKQPSRFPSRNTTNPPSSPLSITQSREKSPSIQNVTHSDPRAHRNSRPRSRSQSHSLDNVPETAVQPPSLSRTHTPTPEVNETNLTTTPKFHQSRSTSTTPRKLGRIGGRGESQRRSQTPTSAPTTPSKRKHSASLDMIPEEETSQPKDKSPSIASTKSTASTASPSPSPSTKAVLDHDHDQTQTHNSQSIRRSLSTRHRGDTEGVPTGSIGGNPSQIYEDTTDYSNSVPPAPVPKLVRQETVEEKANRRRAELKDRLNNGVSGATGPGGGGGGVRKKRKF